MRITASADTDLLFIGLKLHHFLYNQTKLKMETYPKINPNWLHDFYLVLVSIKSKINWNNIVNYIVQTYLQFKRL